MKRGQPLKRGAPLKRVAFPASTLPLKRMGSLKQRGRNYHPVPEEIKAIVYVRALGICEARWKCSGAHGTEYHHVRKRSKGRDDSPENLLLLCHACHIATEQFPAEARERGLVVRGNWPNDAEESE